jgi:hypothetical protein
MGGVGKTELAREVARRMHRQLPKPSGVSQVAEGNLRGWDSEQPMGEEDALRELCAQLDPATDPALPLPNLRGHWQGISGQGWPAVILDNLRDASLIDKLRPTKGITIVTSRESIHRSGITPIEVGVMEPQEAEELARSTHPGLSPEDAAALAEAVGHLPLAITLAAAYLARTGEAVAVLEQRIKEAAGGKPTLQGLFDQVVGLSTADLSAEQVARWQSLSLPPGDFGLWTVQALWEDEDPAPELGELVSRHLVMRAEDGRWRLHDLLRHYGRSVLAAELEREQVLWRRLGVMAVVRLREIDARFQRGGDAMVPALAELDAELSLLRPCRLGRRSGWRRMR